MKLFPEGLVNLIADSRRLNAHGLSLRGHAVAAAISFPAFPTPTPTCHPRAADPGIQNLLNVDCRIESDNDRIWKGVIPARDPGLASGCSSRFSHPTLGCSCHRAVPRGIQNKRICGGEGQSRHYPPSA